MITCGYALVCDRIQARIYLGFTDGFKERVDGLTGALVKRFENIVAQASVRMDDAGSLSYIQV